MWRCVLVVFSPFHNWSIPFYSFSWPAGIVHHILNTSSTILKFSTSPSKPDNHTFVSYFPVFQMPAIPHVFVLQLRNLAIAPILTCSFSWWCSLVSAVCEILFLNKLHTGQPGAKVRLHTSSKSLLKFWQTFWQIEHHNEALCRTSLRINSAFWVLLHAPFFCKATCTCVVCCVRAMLQPFWRATIGCELRGPKINSGCTLRYPNL